MLNIINKIKELFESLVAKNKEIDERIASVKKHQFEIGGQEETLKSKEADLVKRESAVEKVENIFAEKDKVEGLWKGLGQEREKFDSDKKVYNAEIQDKKKEINRQLRELHASIDRNEGQLKSIKEREENLTYDRANMKEQIKAEIAAKI